jgi:hypothetical protein
MIETIIKLILCHIFADYFLQTEYIANNKGKDYYILFIHCALYIIPLYIVFGYTWHLIPVFILHIIIDYLKAFKGKMALWQDQVIHYLTLGVYFI